MNYWLMKCEPAAYTIDDLERDGVTSWEGVRNFQARNFMREMRAGDGVLFYASNADPSGVTGLAEVAREAYPDAFSWKKGHKYFDPRSSPEKPLWFMVDIRFVRKFPRTISIDELREVKALETMVVLRPGNRLSVTPVTKKEYDAIVKLAR